MSVLTEIIRERREWPERQQASIQKRHNLIAIGEFLIFAEIVFLVTVYREVVITWVSKYLGS